MSALDHVPDVRDGLNAIERTLVRIAVPRALQRERSRKVVNAAEVLLEEHDHAALYAVLVQMVAPFRARYPLFNGEGNYGSIDGDPAADSRWTEVRRSKIADHALFPAGGPIEGHEQGERGKALRKPKSRAARLGPLADPLPGPFPTLLANGTWEGLAHIPPHNLGELAAAISARIDDPELDLEGILAIMPGPDYPTGGEVVDPAQVRAAYSTGRGAITVRGRAHVEEATVVVTEIPFLTTKGGDDGLIVEVVQAINGGRIDTISDLSDQSDRGGMRLELEIRPGGDPAQALAQLYEHTTLETDVPVLLVALGRDGSPQQYSLLALIDAYIDHQRAVRVTAGLRDDAEIRASIKADLARVAKKRGDARRTAIGPLPT